MAKEEFEKAENDYDKPTLAHAVGLMLNLHDMQGEPAKLSKPALWRIFDNYKVMGNNFANLEDELRNAQRELLAMTTRAVNAEAKVKTMESRRGKKTRTR